MGEQATAKTTRRDEPGHAAATVAVDRERLLRIERLFSYEILNGLLLMNLDLQQRSGLRAESFQVFMLVVLATVQRFARTSSPDQRHVARSPLPREFAGAISRRRIADVLGIPPETVRRHVAALIAAGLVVETGRGRLSTPGGTLERFAADETPLRIAGKFAALANTLLRQGSIRVTDGG